nr:hypothetical protein [Tanacetum cinerariifolium]
VKTVQSGNQRNWNNLKSQQLGVTKGRTCSTNTHKSNSPRHVIHKTVSSSTRTNRPHVNSARPQATQDLMIILIQRVQRLERELKARTLIQNIDRGKSRSATYALEILHKHGMEKGQSIGTPMATKPKLDADFSGNPVDQTDYCW